MSNNALKLNKIYSKYLQLEILKYINPKEQMAYLWNASHNSRLFYLENHQLLISNQSKPIKYYQWRNSSLQILKQYQANHQKIVLQISYSYEEKEKLKLNETLDYFEKEFPSGNLIKKIEINFDHYFNSYLMNKQTFDRIVYIAKLHQAELEIQCSRYCKFYTSDIERLVNLCENIDGITIIFYLFTMEKEFLDMLKNVKSLRLKFSPLAVEFNDLMEFEFAKYPNIMSVEFKYAKKAIFTLENFDKSYLETIKQLTDKYEIIYWDYVLGLSQQYGLETTEKILKFVGYHPPQLRWMELHSHELINQTFKLSSHQQFMLNILVSKTGFGRQMYFNFCHQFGIKAEESIKFQTKMNLDSQMYKFFGAWQLYPKTQRQKQIQFKSSGIAVPDNYQLVEIDCEYLFEKLSNEKIIRITKDLVEGGYLNRLHSLSFNEFEQVTVLMPQLKQIKSLRKLSTMHKIKNSNEFIQYLTDILINLNQVTDLLIHGEKISIKNGNDEQSLIKAFSYRKAYVKIGLSYIKMQTEIELQIRRQYPLLDLVLN